MSSAVVCPNCAKTLRSAKPLSPGAAVKCPACKQVFTVPDAGDAEDIVNVTVVEPAPRAGGKSSGRPARVRRDDDDDYEERRPARKRNLSDDDDLPPRRRPRYEDDEDDEAEREPARRRRYEDDDDDYDRPKPRKKKKNRVKENAGNAAAAGVLGGLLMMAIAIIWFVVGLMNDYIFFYPPVLFVVGIVAIVKGIASR